ncbi:glycosyltransferase family 2 protein [Flavobacteriaceae bacterium SZ-1-7]|uniref:glycosyltransferase family 2 protein n=1 Tax=Tamlana sedimenti TaxID=3134126 RepID=UPI00312AFF23
MTALSLIIPVYNLEFYIEKCLNSIVGQDLAPDQFEVIIINDGSKDNSKEIIENYTCQYSNFKLFNIENAGVSNARNQGIKHSKGSFLLFIDGDDWLDKGALTKIYDAINQDKFEVAKFGYTKRYANKKWEDIILNDKIKFDSGLDFVVKSKCSYFYPWQYVFSSNLVKSNGLLFNTDLTFSEDKEFLIRVLAHTTRFKYLGFKVYNYNLERESAVSSKISDKSLRDLIDANVLIYTFARLKVKEPNHRKALEDNAISSISNSYYILTTNSIWRRFWIWRNHINNIIEKIDVEKSNRLSYFNRKNGILFYLRYYLPRAIYHKIK